MTDLTAADIASLFTRADGRFLFARWVRPIVPVVFGAQDATISTFKGAIEAVVTLAGHRMAETDPEQGANLMVFLFRDWAELLEVPGLEGLIEGLGPLVARLTAEGASQYRVFRFEPDGAIRAAVVLIRMDRDLERMPAADLALWQAVGVIVLWSDHQPFVQHPPLAQVQGVAVLRRDFAALIRAAYDPVLPAVAHDPSHALRLAARMG